MNRLVAVIAALCALACAVDLGAQSLGCNQIEGIAGDEHDVGKLAGFQGPEVFAC